PALAHERPAIESDPLLTGSQIECRSRPNLSPSSTDNFVSQTVRIDWTSAADGACIGWRPARPILNLGVAAAQPSTPGGLVAVTAPAGARTPERGSDYGQVRKASHDHKRPTAARQGGPAIIRAAQNADQGQRIPAAGLTAAITPFEAG